LVLNFLMWIPVTLAMFSGLGTLVFGSMMPLAGRVFGLICDRSFGSLEWLIDWGRGWPGSYFWLPVPPAWWHATQAVGVDATVHPLALFGLVVAYRPCHAVANRL
jgi:hypothetical protein